MTVPLCHTVASASDTAGHDRWHNDTGLPGRFCCHTVASAGATALLAHTKSLPCRHKVAADARQHLADAANTTFRISGFDVDTISVWETDASDKSLHSWKLVKELRLHPA